MSHRMPRLIRPRPSRLWFALVAAGVFLTVGGIGAGPAAGAGAGAAYVRAAHFSPDTPAVDVYLTSFSGKTTTLWLSGVGYGAVSPYQRLDAGAYTVAMRPHGAAASTPPVLTWNLQAQSGAAYTAAGVGMNKELHAVVLTDQLGQPPAGQVSVRVIQAASRAPSLDVGVADGPSIASGVAFGTAMSYRQVPAGSWTINATGTGGQPAASNRVSLQPGSIVSLVALDAKDASGIRLDTVVDAAGAAAMPQGSVPAGGGGTAPGAGGGGRSVLIAAVFATIAAAAFGRRLTGR